METCDGAIRAKHRPTRSLSGAMARPLSRLAMPTPIKKVLISDTLSPAAIAIFRERGIQADLRPELGKDKEALAAAIGEYDGLAVRSTTKVSAALLERAGKLR